MNDPRLLRLLIGCSGRSNVERFLYQVQFGVDEKTKERLISGVPDAARSSWVTARDGGYR